MSYFDCLWLFYEENSNALKNGGENDHKTQNAALRIQRTITITQISYKLYIYREVADLQIRLAVQYLVMSVYIQFLIDVQYLTML